MTSDEEHQQYIMYCNHRQLVLALGEATTHTDHHAQSTVLDDVVQTPSTMTKTNRRCPIAKRVSAKCCSVADVETARSKQK